MSNHRIEATSAEVKGNYIHVEKRPLRIFWFILGFLFGLLVTAVLFSIYGSHQQSNTVVSLLYLIAAIFFGCTFTFFSGESIEYEIPTGDLLAIKRYPMRRKVTVVFNEERMKNAFVASKNA